MARIARPAISISGMSSALTVSAATIASRTGGSFSVSTPRISVAD